MKKIKLLLFIAIGASEANAQLTIGFENFNLPPNSAYSSTASAPFQESGVSFNHKYAFNFWSEGFAYTNKYDSLTAGFTNLYGIRAGKGRNHSAVYNVGQMKGVISLAPQNTITGMYVTNTTYAYLSIRDGDSFARKFGDTTGTGSGTTIAQGQYPDFFKLIIRAYKGGTLKSDSVTFFLADYRGTNDYIVDTWQFVNTSSLGSADSLVMTLRSSDNGQYGMNTPGFFAIDELSVALSNPVGIAAVEKGTVTAWPNPFRSEININSEKADRTALYDATGNLIRSSKNETSMRNLDTLPAGLYYLMVEEAGTYSNIKVIHE
jgi:hypothetical protein